VRRTQGDVCSPRYARARGYVLLELDAALVLLTRAAAEPRARGGGAAGAGTRTARRLVETPRLSGDLGALCRRRRVA